MRVLKSTLASPEVEGCMTKTVATWSFPEMPANVPYLRTVHIGAEY